jgi:hypothetical protein
MIGSRPAELGPTTVFQLVRGLVAEVVELALRALPTGMYGDDMMLASEFAANFGKPNGMGATLKAEICKEVVASFKPMIRMFAKYSSDKSRPGDLLDAKVADLRAEVEQRRERWGGFKCSFYDAAA